MRAKWAMLVVLALAACAKPGPEAPPVVVEASHVDELVYWSGDLNGKRVSFDGYLNFSQGQNGLGAAMGPELRSQPGGGGEKLIFFQVEHGEGPNQLHLPVLSRETIPGMPGAPEILTVDIAKATYQDTAGQAHPIGDKVRVTGKLVYMKAGKAGLFSEEDSASPVGRRFKPQLVNVKLEPAPDA